MFRVVSIVFILFLSIPLMADVSGSYSGSGHSLMHRSETRRECSEIFLEIKVSDTSVEVARYGYKCADLQAEVDPYRLRIVGSKLLTEDGEEIGSLSDGDLSIFYRSSEENFSYEWRIKRSSEGKFSLFEEWREGERKALTLEGTLARM